MTTLGLKRIVLHSASAASAVFALVYAYITADYTWAYILLCYWLFLRALGEIVFHRYFSHGSFTTGKIRRVMLAWLSILPGSGSILAWSVIHRHHHKFADTKRDVHSPKNSLMESLNLIQFYPDAWFHNKDIDHLHKDLMRDHTVQFNHKHYYTIWLVLALSLLVVSWKVLFLVVLPCVFCITIMTGLTVNTGTHLKLPGSYRNYDTPDNSYNNKWMGWLLLNANAMHNNHHGDPRNYSTAKLPGEYDLTAWFIKVFLKTND